MNEIQIFNNPEFGEVRTVNINNEPWFVGKDIAQILGYVNPRKALLDHVDEEDKRDGVTIRDSIGREQNPTVINESGLYSLVLSSKLPTAKRFKRWVTSEVLPTIRKHGAYMTAETLENALLSPDYLIKIATRLKEEQTARLKAEATIEAQKPKVLFADAVASSKTSILVRDLAKLLSSNGLEIGQNRLFALLRKQGYLIQKEGSDYNMPTQRAMKMGLFEIKEWSHINGGGSNIIRKTPKVTGKGQIFFMNKFLGKNKEKTPCSAEAF